MDIAKLAGRTSKKINKMVQDKIIEAVLDYDIEFAAELDDFAEGKINEEQLNLNRLRIDIDFINMTHNEIFTVYLDNRPILTYSYETDFNTGKIKTIFEKF